VKAFKFSLQKLLESKEALERLGEARIGEQVRGLERLKRDVEELEQRMRNETRRMELSLVDGHTTRHDLSAHFRYRTALRRRRSCGLEGIRQCEKAIDEIRDELLGVIRERKALERLRDNERRQWRLDENRSERSEMDAIAVNGFIRRRKIA